MQQNDYHCVSIIIFNVACDVGCDVFHIKVTCFSKDFTI